MYEGSARVRDAKKPCCSKHVCFLSKEAKALALLATTLAAPAPSTSTASSPRTEWALELPFFSAKTATDSTATRERLKHSCQSTDSSRESQLSSTQGQ
jgi:hypothetical protein